MVSINISGVSAPTLEELKKKPINLYPYKNGRLTKTQKQIRLLLALLIVSGVSVLSYTAYLAYENVKMVTEIETMTANLKVEKERLDNQKLLDELTKRIDYKSELLNFIDKSNASAALVMEVIERNVPKGVSYVDVEFVSDNAIRVTCVTHNQEWVAKLVHELKAEKFFTAVFVESITKTEQEEGSILEPQYEFHLICTFGGQKNETQN